MASLELDEPLEDFKICNCPNATLPNSRKPAVPR